MIKVLLRQVAFFFLVLHGGVYEIYGIEGAPFIVNLTPTVEAGKTCVLYVGLPARQTEGQSWDVILSGGAVEHTDRNLPIRAEGRTLQCFFQATGTYKAILQIRNQDGSLVSYSACDVAVVPSWVLKEVGVWGIPILTGVIAVLVYLAQRRFAGAWQKKKKAQDLRDTLIVFVAYALKRIKSRKEVEMPGWLRRPSESPWANEICSDPFMTYILTIESILDRVESRDLDEGQAEQALEEILGGLKSSS